MTPAEETVWRTEKRGEPREREGEEGNFQPGQKLDRSQGMRRMTDLPARGPERKKESPDCGPPSCPVSDNPARWWQGIIWEALIEGEFIPQVFPVIAALGNPNQHQWVGLDWKLVREGQKAVMQYGLTNPYVQTFLDHIFTSGLMTPFDCRKLAEIFLKPTQRLL